MMATSAFGAHILVLAHDCDFMGHVNNATYVRYLHQATLDACSGQKRVNPPTLRKLSIEYQSPSSQGDVLEVSAWKIEPGNPSGLLGYRITRPHDSTAVVSAEIEWAGFTGATDETEQEKAPDGMERPLKAFALPPDDPSAYQYHWRNTVRTYELDFTGRVQPAVYFNWLEEATIRAADAVGWPLERMSSAGSVIIQYRHDAEFLEAAEAADEVEIVSRLVDVRRVRGSWLHDLVRTTDGTRLMRNYSTGVWLDNSGHMNRAPAGMMEACVAGPRRRGAAVELSRQMGMLRGKVIVK